MMLNYNTLKKMICLPLNGKKSFFYLTFPAMIANAGRYPMCAWQDIYFSKQKKDADIERLTQQMVQEKRFELSRDCSHCRLKTACLPFHHFCIFYVHISYTFFPHSSSIILKISLPLQKYSIPFPCIISADKLLSP